MKSIIVVFGALLVIISLPLFFSSINNAQTESYVQTFAGVTTGAGVYSANRTLSESLFNNSVTHVLGISSNVSADSPSATSYTGVSKLLVFGGLAQSETRTLEVTYQIDSSSLPTGMGTFFTVIRWFMVFAIIGLIAAAIYAFFD